MAYGDPFYPDFYQEGDPYGGSADPFAQDPLPAPGRPPAPKRLTMEELLGLMQEGGTTPKPLPISNVDDLTGADRRNAQLGSVWQGLATLGAGMNDPRALQGGVDRVAAAQQGVMADVNKRNDVAYQNTVAQNAADVAQEQAKQKAGALFGTYQKIASTEPPDSPFVADAEAAAKIGDMSKLQTMLGQVPQRAAARKAGLDPDAWATNQRLQGELQAELEKQKQAALLPGKVAEAQQVGDVKSAQELAREKAVKIAPGWQAPLQLEPISYVKAKAEAEAAVKDAHAKAQQLVPRFGVSQGQWGLIKPDPVTGAPTFTPASGQPQKVGKYHYVTIDGVPYAQDTEHPEQGAFPVQLHSPKETAPWAGGQKPATPTPRPTPAPAAAPSAAPAAANPVAAVESAVGRPLSPAVRAQIVADLRSGKSPAAIAAQIREAMGGQP